MPPLKPIALLLAAAFQTATPGSSTVTFHSDVLHLDYTYASSFTAMPNVANDAIQAEKDKATGATKAAISCITLPLTAIDSSNGFRMILIMRVDGTCLGTPAAASEISTLTTSALTESLKRFGDPQVGTTVDYQVASHPAAVVPGFVKSEKYGATFFGTASCLIQGKDAVCWELLSSDCSALPALMANPITFEGQPAQPLIPAKFAQPCKP